MTNNEFENKVFLVDGAGSGMGKETAIRLSKLGGKVALVDLDEEALKATMAEMDENNHCYWTADLSKIDELNNLISSIVNKMGPIKGFVHCVGVRCRRPLKILTNDVLHSVFTINLYSFIELLRLITKKGNFDKGLNVVSISSISSLTGGAGITAYSSSKAAMDGAVRSLASELATKGIRINTVLPGQINTPAYAKMIESSGGVDKVMERQYLGLGEASDVVNMIEFLLSDKSKLITGAAIPLDGGYLTS